MSKSPGNQEVDLALVKHTAQYVRVGGCDIKYNSWVASRKSIDNGRSERGGEKWVTPNSHASCRWIGKKFDVLDCPVQVVKRCGTTIKQGTTELGRLDAAAMTVEQPAHESMFKFCYRSRDGRLSNAKPLRRLSHGARLHYNINNGHVLTRSTISVDAKFRRVVPKSLAMGTPDVVGPFVRTFKPRF